ncbi:MAG: endolytic transglycosylase MltG [Deltaproteobacteria bacterium]|nr:endolytic transglycosylase MltG [Deltaproteobacteria bacterium]
MVRIGRLTIRWKIVGSVSLLILSFLLSGWLWLEQWSRTPQPLGQELLFSVDNGVGLRRLSQNLAEKGLIRQPRLFQFWVRLQGQAKNIQAGRYRVDHSVSPEELLHQMVNGKVWNELTLEWVVPEGFTQQQIIARLAAISGLPELSFRQVAEDPQFVFQLLGIQAPDLEGFLFPATYRLYNDHPAPRTLFRMMVSEFFKRLPDDFDDDCQRMGLSLREAVTFASLIEKETRLREEKALVSEVIWNRLRKGMSLGIDAALIYGIADFDGNLRTKHLSDRSNVYNTRVHRGLPPGPVGSPGLESLQAVLSPANHGYLYYVLRYEMDGRHHFSRTLKEHNHHVRQLIRAQRKSNRQ